MALTLSFVFQYERRMKAITENEYVRRLMAEHMWWNKVMRTTNIEGRTERMTWFLDTATIQPAGPDFNGTMSFKNMVTQTAEYPTFHHNKGIRVHVDQIEDLDGTGLNKVVAYIASLRMPNGRDPRFLRPVTILAPPKLMPRLSQLTDAKFIAQAAASGGGSADVIAYISRLGLGQPQRVDEFQSSASYNFQQPFMGTGGNVTFKPGTASGDDKTYYVVCQEMQTTQL